MINLDGKISKSRSQHWTRTKVEPHIECRDSSIGRNYQYRKLYGFEFNLKLIYASVLRLLRLKLCGPLGGSQGGLFEKLTSPGQFQIEGVSLFQKFPKYRNTIQVTRSSMR